MNDGKQRPDPPVAGTEVETLLGFLDFQRATLEWKCADLDDDQLRTRLHPTTMTLAGLLMHLARVEDIWFGEVVAEAGPLEPWSSTPWAQEWETSLERTGDDLRGLWADRVAASRQVVADQFERLGDAALDATHPAWGGRGHPSLRWVLVHMIEEYARHVGHADLLREAVDGSTGE